MKEKRYKIWVPYGKVTLMAQHYGVCTETIRRALENSFPNNIFHEEIRKEAVNKYGGQRIRVR